MDAERAEQRRLRLLRIDDDVHLQSADAIEYAAFEFVHVQRGKITEFGISGWEGAIGFWKTFSTDRPIDLVISDVKFIDTSSPLNNGMAGTRLELPTGLSHLKPFAAIARASGLPIGIAIHTADELHWSKQLEADPIPSAATAQILSLFAAHEIGELAAILGEADSVDKGDLESCWAWLTDKRRGSNEHRSAICCALEDYRRRLAEAAILPSDWNALVGWCAEMHRKAEREGGVNLTSEVGPGLRLLRADGAAELPISLLSLFGDVGIRNPECVFDRDVLPSRCFEMVESDRSFELDEDRLPRIGSLIVACGDWAKAAERALDILLSFPLPPPDPINATLAGVIGSSRRELGVGLAVLFQEMRCEHWLFENWTRTYLKGRWDFALDELLDEHDEAKPIAYWVDVVWRFIGSRSNPVSLADVAQHMYARAGADDLHMKMQGAIRCLELLESLGLVVEEGGGGKYRKTVAKYEKGKVPRLPQRLPKGAFEHGYIPLLFRDGRGSLRQSSGVLTASFGGHENSVLRYVCYGFGRSNLEEARQFLNAFRAGNSPGRIKAICRDFASRRLGWTDTATWPRAIA